ncbi:endogenous retrovirus group PABLB member 1 Env polyprotein-like [Ranitomeya imitator]|uniref:endogenous retrovirus group PABLB member 1 Env polyprotein-like n=1 Tax=Ranitomeya imitator TaxID=111125 RepID=UPI0037E74233
MDTCKPLQKSSIRLMILMLIMLTSTEAWERLNSLAPLNNRFVQHHRKLVHDLLNNTQPLADCWICTHSPVSATSMPFLAVPVSAEEIFAWPNCSDNPANNQPGNTRLWNTSIAIPIVGWVEFPWWQGNLTGKIDNLQYLAFKGGKWVPRNKTGLTDLGQVPTENLQLSFSTTTPSSDAFKPTVLERYIHNRKWEHSELFPQGDADSCTSKPGNLVCNESNEYVNGMHVCGNPAAGYCSPLGQKPSWCMLQNVSSFVDLAHRLVLQHSALWDLPEGTFWICGEGAYKWLPVGIKGTCTLGRLTPATFIISNKQVNMQAVPKHTLYKRAADNSPRPSGRPHIVQMGIPNKIASTIFIYPMLTQMWDKLVRATDYLDDQIWDILDILNTSIAVQNQLIIVTNQHTLVLDYLTASQGGMCQIIGPTCCHYIDPNSTMSMRFKLKDVQRLRDQYDKDNDQNKDSWWSDTFSFLNPANWFRGIGGWVTGIMQSLIHTVMVIVIIYVLFKVVLKGISVCTNKFCVMDARI